MDYQGNEKRITVSKVLKYLNERAEVSKIDFIQHINLFMKRIRIIDRARKSEVKYYFYDNQLYKINIKKGINLFKTKIIEQLLDKAFLADQKVDIINTLHNNNKYRIDQNDRLILIYLDDLNLEDSKNINLAMGYKPLVEKLNEE